MSPAKNSKRHFEQTKLLELRPGVIAHRTVADLPNLLELGSLLVANRSATLPSSFHGLVARTNEPVEIRLAAYQGPSGFAACPSSSDKVTCSLVDLKRWKAFSFGAGDWRQRTEERGQPPQLRRNDVVIFGPQLSLRILDVEWNRLLTVEFESSDLVRELYRWGRPIQYSYLEKPLEVWDQQTIFSGPPISVEAPSAAFPINWQMLVRLQSRGIQVVSLLHGAGISSSGDPKLDRLLPLREWFQIPSETATEIDRAQQAGRAIIALGTSALRALESAAQGGSLVAGSGLTDLKISGQRKTRIATGLITGLHDLGTSHRKILGSFCPIETIARGYAEAEERGYHDHEYGDVSLLNSK